MKRFLNIAAIALIVAGCSGKNRNTVLVGDFSENDPGTVKVTVKAMGIDTTVNIVDASFRLEIPTDVTALGVVRAESFKPMRFIPDGSEITVDFAGESVVSSNPEGPQTKLTEMQDSVSRLFDEYTAKAESAEDESAVEDEMMAALVDYVKAVVCENADNGVASYALSNFFYYMTPDEALECVEKLSEPLKATETIQKIQQSSEAAKVTAEGNPFVDFEVDGVKFSDYIGKGKYVLVDFWASWCGPCRGEIPNIKAVYEKYKGENFDVLGVAAWDKPEDTQKAIEEEGIAWSQIINSQNIATDAYGISGIPMIILFGPDGTIIRKELRGEEIEAAVKEALGR